MNTILWIMGWIAYLTGWFATSVRATRWWAAEPYCHSPHKDSRSICKNYHPVSCYRGGDRPTKLLDALAGCILGIVWPFLLPIVAVQRVAQGGQRRVLLTAEELARLEQEAGIRPSQGPLA